MFNKSETTVGSAVATSGTITLSYPANTSAGSFAAYGHKLWVDKFQRLLTSPADFTISFGASNITVTYLGSTTIPVGARVNAQLNIEGVDNGELTDRLEETNVRRSSLSNMVVMNLGSPIAADPNGVVVSQDLTAAGVFSVSITAAAAIAAGALAGTFDSPRNVVAAWTTTSVLTITGTDEYGNIMVESSASGTSFTGAKAFKTITDVSASISVTSLTVGTGNVLGLPSFLGADAYITSVKEGTTSYDKGSKVYLNSNTPALSSASQVYGVSPVAGHITAMDAVTTTALGTADSTLTAKTAAGTVGTITIAFSGTAVGIVDSLSGPANTLVAAGGTVEIENNAAPSAGAASVTTVIEPGGALVVGVSAAGTATTGDNRGTYDPIATLDGSTEITITGVLPEPKYLGVAQYAG